MDKIRIQNSIIHTIPEPHGGKLVNRIFELKNDDDTNDMFSIDYLIIRFVGMTTD